MRAATIRTKTPQDIFERHLDLAPLRGRRRGLVRCVFHDDANPSLSVDLDRAVFHCFGCGVEGGVKRFAELVGERLEASARASRGPSPFKEARERAFAEICRQRERLAPYRDLMAVGDFIRRRLPAVDEVRRLATALGPGEAIWAALALAAEVERQALALEGELDDILAGGRIA